MALWLKQSTAPVISFGPFLDATNGVDLEAAISAATLDHVTTGIRISKNGGAFAARNATVTATTYDAMGCYLVTLDATDTGTLGYLRMIFEEAATCLPVWQDFMIVPANVWDSFFGADNLDVSVIQVAGSTTNVAALATNVDAIKTKVDFLPAVTAGGTGGLFIAGTNAATTVTTSFTTTFTGSLTGNVDGSVGSVTGAVGSVTGHTNQTGDSFLRIGAAGVSLTNLGGSSNNWNVGKTGYTLTQAFPTNFADMSITVTTGLVDVTQTAADKVWSTAARTVTAATNITSTGGTTFTQTGDSFALIGTAGVGLTNLGGSSNDWNTTTPPTAVAIADQVWDEELTVGHVIADSAGAKLNAAGGAADPWATVLPGSYGAATAGEILGDWLNTGRLDAILDELTVNVDANETKIDTLTTTVGAAGVGLTAVALADTTSDAVIADAVWEALTATYGGVGSYGEHVESLTAGGDATQAKQDSIIAAVITNATGVDIAADIIALKAETVLIVADTGELQTDWVDGGRLDNLLDGAASAGDPWTTTLPGGYGAGTAGNIVGNNLDAVLSARTLASADYFDPAADTVANVTLVATTTTNTDMRGTDSAALASVCTEARLAELDAANLPADVANVSSRIGVGGAGLTRVLDGIEYTRGHHTVSGTTFYVDGTGGNDTTGDGTRALPWKTISKAHTACTTNAHDQIILLPNASGGPTVITESASIAISKNYVQIRGPGRDLEVTLNTSGNVFDITADGVGLSGFKVTTFSGATSAGVEISGGADFVRLYKLWILAPHRDGVRINVGNFCEIDDCVIGTAGRDGIRIDSGIGSGEWNRMTDNIIRDCTGSGINMQGSDASRCRIHNNLIRNNVVGITVASGAEDVSITDNRLVANGTSISDSGTDTLQMWNYLATSTLGAVDRVTLVDTVTTNTDMRGTDSAALATSLVTAQNDLDIITGATGVNLLAATQASIDAIETDTSTNLDATVSSRMATYTQPTGFLAATFPTGTVANTTNITGGTITTVTTNTDMRGTDSAALATSLVTAQNDLDILTGADGVNLLTATQASIDAIEADTNELQLDWMNTGRLDTILDAIATDTTTDIPALISGLNDISAANVLTQVNAALDTAIDELGVGAPTATPTMRTGLIALYMALTQKVVVQTSGVDALEVYDSVGVKIFSKALTDDGSDYIEAKAT